MADNEPGGSFIDLAAERGAERAIRNVFRLLGVDIDDQRQVNEFRSDLVYIRKIRKVSDQASALAIRGFLSAVVLGTLIAMKDGLIRGAKQVLGIP